LEEKNKKQKEVAKKEIRKKEKKKKRKSKKILLYLRILATTYSFLV